MPPDRVTWYLPSGSGDRWPQDYERGRPGWPPEAVHIPGLPSTSTVLDLAAGTGKLTRLLIRAFRRVVAVEPQDAMRRVLHTLCPEAEVHGGTAEEIPLPDASLDAVFVAQAFHWFDNARALAEIARVLRPRAALVVMWNHPLGPWEPSIAAAEEFLLQRVPGKADLGFDPLDLGSPRYASGMWRLAFETSPFGELHEAQLPNPQTLDRDGLLAFLASMGWIADLPDVDRLPLLEDVLSLLNASEYSRAWQTQVHWTCLR
jgi:SAM-dependent methyltransferase